MAEQESQRVKVRAASVNELNLDENRNFLPNMKMINKKSTAALKLDHDPFAEGEVGLTF